MKEAMVSELKAQLSKYLGWVRKGETVIVRDRQTPIAKLIPYRRKRGTLRLIRASVPPEEIRSIVPVKLLKPVDPVQLLRRERDSR